MHLEFYKPKLFLGVNSIPNYIEKLKFKGIDTTTL
jgi:hypothetical protein